MGCEPADLSAGTGQGAKAPRAVLVVGDVNSTIACALVAAKKGVPVIHVEAGLRSFDRRMPGKINRVLTDQISDLLSTTERGALVNLQREGIDPRRVHFVGNVMTDTPRRNHEGSRRPDCGLSPLSRRLRFTRRAGTGPPIACMPRQRIKHDMTDAAAELCNVMTVDVEDYFQVAVFADHILRHEWEY